mmetsp:Transcript_11427/g.28390  ORF Transcript_11427/g.28390 Transcript_11427/m.28390 type:complete len:275 (-) Transcript_11427:1441-2265(-)
MTGVCEKNQGEWCVLDSHAVRCAAKGWHEIGGKLAMGRPVRSKDVLFLHRKVLISNLNNWLLDVNMKPLHRSDAAYHLERGLCTENVGGKEREDVLEARIDAGDTSLASRVVDDGISIAPRLVHVAEVVGLGLDRRVPRVQQCLLARKRNLNATEDLPCHLLAVGHDDSATPFLQTCMHTTQQEFVVVVRDELRSACLVLLEVVDDDVWLVLGKGLTRLDRVHCRAGVHEETVRCTINKRLKHEQVLGRHPSNTLHLSRDAVPLVNQEHQLPVP